MIPGWGGYMGPQHPEPPKNSVVSAPVDMTPIEDHETGMKVIILILAMPPRYRNRIEFLRYMYLHHLDKVS